MARPEKVAAVAELVAAFRSSSAAVLTEYRGLSVAQLGDLRDALAGEARYAVVKNTLTRRAAAEAGALDLDELLAGPSAVAFVSGDPVAVAKRLRDFARANPALVIKGGVLEGRTVSADEFRRLADLESREVLLARLAGALTATLSQAAALFAAPLAQMARLAAALREKLPAAEEGPEPVTSEPGTPEPVAAELADSGEAGGKNGVGEDEDVVDAEIAAAAQGSENGPARAGGDETEQPSDG